MQHFTPVSAVVGGLLIGIGAVTLLLFNGRIMGITGITGGILRPERGDLLWRVVFLSSLASAPLLYSAVIGEPIHIEVTDSLAKLIGGGFLIGFGACVGSGCTSGHGICGLGRRSKRSLVVTVTFFATALIMVYAMRHLAGSLS